MITHDISPKDDQVAIESMTIKYIQNEDDMSPDNSGMQSLILKTRDAGAGVYFVLSTERWAFESFEELEKVFEDFKTRIYGIASNP